MYISNLYVFVVLLCTGYNPCMNGATCLRSGTEIMCLCHQGFTGYYCENTSKAYMSQNNNNDDIDNCNNI